MRLTSLYKCVLVLIVRVDITVALFLNKCPDKLMWDLRAKNLCGARDKYMCLYDTNAGSFRELCKNEPEFHRPGHIFIISGNLKYFAGRSCKIDKYQPYKWWTNGSSECHYLKSTCNEEGQVPYDDGTATNDRKCRCDYTNYYTFVSGVRNKCYCDHTVEDCSCNKKKCSDDQVLTPDYDCVGIHAWTGRFVCPEYKAPKIVGEKKLPQTTTTICPLVKPDFPGTIQQSKARIAHTTMFIVIIISGVIVLVMIRRYRSFDKRAKILDELREEAFGERAKIVKELKEEEALGERAKIVKELKEEEDKIRLLKNYQEIVENIISPTIIRCLPPGVVSDKNRNKIESMYTKTQKARALIDILIHSDQTAYLSFLAELRKNELLKHLADKIEETKVTDEESIREFDALLKDPVPIYLKELHERQLTEWIECQDQIVTTSAIDNLYTDLQHDSRITIIGPRGSGKTSTLRAAAIRLMTNDDFEIIPCTEPSEIISCLRTYCKQIFVFDDVCETTSRAVSFLEEWNKRAALIEKMIQTPDNKNRKKILIAVDSFSYHMMDMINKSNDISSFSSVFEMERNSLSEKEAKDIAKKHRNTDNTLYEYSNNIFFYPELCRRYGFYMKIEHCVHIESLLYEIIDDFLKVLVKDDEVFLASMLLFVIHGKSINLSMLHEKLDRMSDVIGLKKDSLTFSAISGRFEAMIESDMYIDYVRSSDENHACYSVINDELFMGIVSFFYHNYFDEILQMSTDDSMSNMLQEWKTHIEHRKIKLPHHNQESMANYFDVLSSSVISQKQMQSYREKFRKEKKPE